MPPQRSTSSDADADCGSLPQLLVMDDDPLFRTLLVSMLNRDYDVTAAADGSEGFHKALASPPEVAVIDIQMPVWNGLRTIRAFREHELLKSVGLLVLSSDASKETVLAAIAAGADDYAIKTGFSREHFLQKISRIRETRWLAPAAKPSQSCGGELPAAAHSDRAARPDPNENYRHQLQEVLDAWE